jgi:hypothetical protein
MHRTRAFGLFGVLVFGGFAARQYLESGLTLGMGLSVGLALVFAVTAARGR